MKVIKGRNISLIEVQEDDLEIIREWRNKYAEHFFDASQITKSRHRQWYDNMKNKGDYFFVISHHGTKIGTISLYNIDMVMRQAEVGRVILIEEYRGLGFAEEAVGLICDLADELHIYKLHVSVFIENIDAIAVYARQGFKSMRRPAIILERVHYDKKKEPIKDVKTYDELAGEDGYEGQNSNIAK